MNYGCHVDPCFHIKEVLVPVLEWGDGLGGVSRIIGAGGRYFL